MVVCVLALCCYLLSLNPPGFCWQAPLTWASCHPGAHPPPGPAVAPALISAISARRQFSRAEVWKPALPLLRGHPCSRPPRGQSREWMWKQAHCAPPPRFRAAHSLVCSILSAAPQTHPGLIWNLRLTPAPMHRLPSHFLPFTPRWAEVILLSCALI